MSPCGCCRADNRGMGMRQPMEVDRRARARLPFSRPATSTRALLEDIPRDPRRWREILRLLLQQHNWAHGSKDKGVSYKTMAERRKFLYAFFRELRHDPKRQFLLDPRSLGRRHVEHAVRRWEERGLAPGTIQAYLSHLRVFARWIGKDGLVAAGTAYVEDPQRVRRTYAATEDKSWSGKNVDFSEVVARVERIDVRVAAQLRMCEAFGLRVKEAIMLRPHLAVVGDRLAVIHEQDYDEYLEVVRGTKGGRRRFVPIVTAQQVEAIEIARRTVTATHESLAHPSLRLHQAYRRFYYVLQSCGVTKARLGITAHGLRHGFAHRRYQDHTGSEVPIYGGGSADAASDQRGRMAVSRELGHARKSISEAYLGGLLKQGRLPLDLPAQDG